jgi:hypothetical protein
VTDRVLVALIAHRGHDGLPGAPEDVLCLRCNAERELERLQRIEEKAQRVVAHKADFDTVAERNLRIALFAAGSTPDRDAA